MVNRFDKKTIFVLSISFVVFLSILIFSFINLFLTSQPSLYEENHLNEIDRGVKEKGGYSHVINNKSTYYLIDEESTDLLSNFGDLEYKCTGTCYCSSSNNRRITTATTMTKSLKLFLTAFSVTIAYKIAKESFHNQCVQKYSDSCTDTTTILSKVDECEEEDNEIDGVTIRGKRIEEEEIRKFEEQEGFRKYLCSGNCVKIAQDEREDGLFGHDVSLGEFMSIGYEKIGTCESIKYEKALGIRHDPAENPQGYNTMARYQFATGPLNQYCRQKSLISMSESQGMGNKARDAADAVRGSAPEFTQQANEFENWIPFCVGAILGRSTTGELGVSSLENVKCLDMPVDPL